MSEERATLTDIAPKNVKIVVGFDAKTTVPRAGQVYTQ
jgi:hypothetical protein